MDRPSSQRAEPAGPMPEPKLSRNGNYSYGNSSTGIISPYNSSLYRTKDLVGVGASRSASRW